MEEIPHWPGYSQIREHITLLVTSGWLSGRKMEPTSKKKLDHLMEVGEASILMLIPMVSPKLSNGQPVVEVSKFSTVTINLLVLNTPLPTKLQQLT
jgi:hypothetical protein